MLAADGFSFPTSLCIDPDGSVWVAESGLPWDGAPAGGVVCRIDENGGKNLIISGLRHPVNGLCCWDGDLIVSEGGFPGRISRLTKSGERTTIIDGLPGMGNYHTNMVAPGPDGKLYFGQGALTNLGVIGLDAYDLGWLKQLPHCCDMPGYTIELNGQVFETADPLAGDPTATTRTGAFSDFGNAWPAGTRLEAALPCTAAVMRCNPDGSDLELVAWGIRNAYGLGFLPDGRLIATDQGSDDRGSRPIAHVPELVFEVKKGAWYGWPDFVGGVPVTDMRFAPTRGPQPQFILSNHHELPAPEKPLMELPINSSATKFDTLPLSHPQFPGQIIMALFGDEKPMTAPPGSPSGRCIVRINPKKWTFHSLPDLQLDRPIDVKYNPSDDCVWILDFGKFEMSDIGVEAQKSSGKLWKIKSSDLFSNS